MMKSFIFTLLVLVFASMAQAQQFMGLPIAGETDFRDVAISADGTVAAASALGQVYIWDKKTTQASYIPTWQERKEKVSLKSVGYAPGTVVLSEDGTLLAAFEDDLQVFQKETDGYHEISHIDPASMRDGYFLSTGTLIYASTLGIMSLKKGNDTGERLQCPVNIGCGTQLAAHPSGTFITAATKGNFAQDILYGAIATWPIVGEGQLGQPAVRWFEGPVWDVAYSADGTTFAVAVHPHDWGDSPRCRIYIYDIKDSKLVRKINTDQLVCHLLLIEDYVVTIQSNNQRTLDSRRLVADNFRSSSDNDQVLFRGWHEKATAITANPADPSVFWAIYPGRGIGAWRLPRSEVQVAQKND